MQSLSDDKSTIYPQSVYSLTLTLEYEYCELLKTSQ
jgi:hypothetical protein